jgi:hypothetical protein
MDDLMVEKTIMDLVGNIEALQNAWDKNHEAVKKEILVLMDARNSLSYVVSRIIAGAA